MDNILLSNIETFERDVIIYTDDDHDLGVKTEHSREEHETKLPVQVMEASSSTVYRYNCEHCVYKTNKKSNYDSHVRVVHQKEKSRCPECHKDFANLNQHLRVSHKIFKAQARENLCELCNTKFHNLEAHLNKVHRIKPATEYPCHLCHKSFSTKEHLTKHEQYVHLGMKPKRSVCPYCNNQFYNLDKHIKSKHSNSQVIRETVKVLYPCNLCEKIFNKKQDLNTHKENIHFLEVPSNKEPCPHCHKEYNNLSQHIEIVHKNTKKFSCQNCQKAFYDNRELRRHHIKFLQNGDCAKKVPDGNCKFVCDYENCNYRSNKKSNMEMHKESVHMNVKYACPECGKNLSSKVNLNSHVKNVHSKKMVGGVLEKSSFQLSFKCRLCDYTTNRALHLDRHILSVHSVAAFETVEQVYQASTQGQLGSLEQEKPAVSELIRSQLPRSNARLPQFANLVRLEKMSEPGTGDEHCHEEMILGDPVDEARSEEIQFVTTTSPPDPDQVLRRLSTTDSLLHDHETTLDTHDPQIVTQTSTFQVDASGKLIIPEYATIVLSNANGLVLPMLEANTGSQIYLTLNN